MKHGAAGGKMDGFAAGGAGSAQGDGHGGGQSGPSSGDRMAYLADMILELRDMAEKAKTPAVAVALSLAYLEARQELINRGLK